MIVVFLFALIASSSADNALTSSYTLDFLQKLVLFSYENVGPGTYLEENSHERQSYNFCTHLGIKLAVEPIEVEHIHGHSIATQWFYSHQDELHASTFQRPNTSMLVSEGLIIHVSEHRVTVTVSDDIDEFYLPTMILQSPQHEFLVLQGVVKAPAVCIIDIVNSSIHVTGNCSISSVHGGALRPYWHDSVDHTVIPFHSFPSLFYMIPEHNNKILKSPGAFIRPIVDHMIDQLTYYESLFNATHIDDNPEQVSENLIIKSMEHAFETSKSFPAPNGPCELTIDKTLLHEALQQMKQCDYPAIENPFAVLSSVSQGVCMDELNSIIDVFKESHQSNPIPASNCKELASHSRQESIGEGIGIGAGAVLFVIILIVFVFYKSSPKRAYNTVSFM